MRYLENLIQVEIIQEIGWTLFLALWLGMAIPLLPVFRKRKKGALYGIRRRINEEAIFHHFSSRFLSLFVLVAFLFLTAFTTKSIDNQHLDVIKSSPEATSGFEELNAERCLSRGISIEDSSDFGKSKNSENNRPNLIRILALKAAQPKIQPTHLFAENSLEAPVIISKNESLALDTVPAVGQEKREFELLERIVRQIGKTIENMKHELYVTKANGIGDLKKLMEERENELNKAAKQLELKAAQLEKEEIDNFLAGKARQVRQYELAVRQLNEEKEKISSDTIQVIEKQMEEQKMQLNRAIWDLQLRRSDVEAKKGEISEEEYEMLEYELDQAERHLKETLQVQLDQQKMDFKRELENAKMKVQFEEELLELQKRQLDLNWKQHELQLETERAEILSAKKELEIQRKELASQNIEKAQKKVDIQRQLAAEEVEMLEIALKILKKEWQERQK